MAILLLISILILVFFIYYIYTSWKNKNEQNEDEKSEVKENENCSFPMILDDFKQVQVYHNVDPRTIAKKYNIKQTQYSNPLPKQENYELGLSPKRKI